MSGPPSTVFYQVVELSSLPYIVCQDFQFFLRFLSFLVAGMAESSTSLHRRVGDHSRDDNLEMKDAYKVSEASDDKRNSDRELPVYGEHDGAWSDAPQDHLDMQRLGKKQEFKRNFNFLSALGFVSIYMYVLV